MKKTPAKEGALQGRRVAITGRLSAMSREEALTFLQMVGAIHDRIPEPETDYLVVGEGSWPLDDEGKPTASLESARELHDAGSSIEIISETQFLALLGLDELLRLYTTQQLSRILGISSREIRSWVRRGLVRPVKIVNRLYYFDFAQVASAKSLHDLIRSGVPPARIRETLKSMETWIPGASKSLTQLRVLEKDGRLLVRLDDGALVETSGQIQLNFGQVDLGDGAPGARNPAAGLGPAGAGNPAAGLGPVGDGNPAAGLGPAGAGNPAAGLGPAGAGNPAAGLGPAGAGNPAAGLGPAGDGSPESATPAGSEKIVSFEQFLRRKEAKDKAHAQGLPPSQEGWFDTAVELEEAGRLKEAAEAYLKALAVDGPSAETAFNLGNVLFGLGRKEEAVQRFLQAVEIEPGYIEGWNNLANVLFEIDRPEEAVTSLRKSLAVDPTYADAHYNLAEILHHLGRSSEACDHWRSYLEQDPNSSWADHVRERLRNASYRRPPLGT